MSPTHGKKRDPIKNTMQLSDTTSSLVAQLQESKGLTPCLIVMRGLDVGNVIRLEKAEMVVGRDEDADIHLTDEGISWQHARFVQEGGRYRVEDLGSTNGVYVNGNQIESARLDDGDKILLGRSTVLKYSEQDELELEFQRRIHESASIDGLTGALNRRSLEQRLQAEWSFAHRHGTDVSVIMMDVDHFKRVNDGFGHTVGDEVLKTLGNVVRETIRMEDLFGRYGGEEFLLVVRGVGPYGAEGLANRLRRTVEALKLTARGKPVPVTISLGVATSSSKNPLKPEELVKLADKRLYQAKSSGRNRVVGDD